MRHPANTTTRNPRHPRTAPTRPEEHRRTHPGPRWTDLPEFFDDDSAWRDVAVRLAQGDLIKGRCL